MSILLTRYRIMFGTVAVTLFFLFSFAFTSPVHASLAGQDLSGWAWSSTIGWISFNCDNTSSCAANGGYDYGVSIDASDNVVGHAWSDNIGWIRFGGLFGFPVGAGTVSSNATMVGAGPSYTLQGWARACAGTVPGDCSSMTSRADGWDGWISFSGATHSVDFTAAGVDASAGNRWAWGGGGSTGVVGWIDMTGVTVGTPVPPAPSTLSFVANPTVLAVGDSATLFWDATGLTACTASNDRGQTQWDASTVVTLGNASVVVQPPEGTTVYRLSCDGVEETVTIEARYDIIINGLSFDTPAPAPRADGYFDGVDFLFNIANSFPLGLDVPYQFTVTNTTLGTTQVISGNDVVRTGSSYDFGFGPNDLEMNGVMFGNQYAELEIDLTGSDVVPEDIPLTAADEDIEGNARTSAPFFIPPPQPTLALVPADEVLRAGEDTTLALTIQSPIQISCRLLGPGIDQSFGTLPPGNAATAYTPLIVNNNQSTGPLRSTSEYELSCVEPLTGFGPGEPGWSLTTLIEIIPAFQEI